MEFEQIYSTYFKSVYLFVRQLSGDEHIAEEIAHETFFKAMRSLDSFRGDCDIRVWLCQIAKNCYYSFLKKAGRIIRVEDAELLNIPSQDETVEERVLQKDEANQIQKILHGIPDPYKEVFMWRIFAELSYKQIGQIFNKSENWACVTYHRARNMIRERLGDSQHEK